MPNPWLIKIIGHSAAHLPIPWSVCPRMSCLVSPFHDDMEPESKVRVRVPDIADTHRHCYATRCLCLLESTLRVQAQHNAMHMNQKDVHQLMGHWSRALIPANWQSLLLSVPLQQLKL
jgi:hypothetical protein